jgi:hypothetical protein
MGQHKHNPNCQLAKEGKLPDRPKKMSKRELERLLYSRIYDELMRVGGIGKALEMAGVDTYKMKKETLETYEAMKDVGI